MPTNANLATHDHSSTVPASPLMSFFLRQKPLPEEWRDRKLECLKKKRTNNKKTQKSVTDSKMEDDWGSDLRGQQLSLHRTHMFRKSCSRSYLNYTSLEDNLYNSLFEY